MKVGARAFSSQQDMMITFSQSKSLGVQKVNSPQFALNQLKNSRAPFLNGATRSGFFYVKQANTFFIYPLKYFSNEGWSKVVYSYPKASTKSITFSTFELPAAPSSSPAPPNALPQPMSISSSFLTTSLDWTLFTVPSYSVTNLQESEIISVPVKASVQSFIFNNQINIMLLIQGRNLKSGCG